jgi:hypothetical protein
MGKGMGQGKGLSREWGLVCGEPCAAFAEAWGRQKQEHASRAGIRSCSVADGKTSR